MPPGHGPYKTPGPCQASTDRSNMPSNWVVPGPGQSIMNPSYRRAPADIFVAAALAGLPRMHRSRWSGDQHLPWSLDAGPENLPDLVRGSIRMKLYSAGVSCAAAEICGSLVLTLVTVMIAQVAGHGWLFLPCTDDDACASKMSLYRYADQDMHSQICNSPQQDMAS